MDDNTVALTLILELQRQVLVLRQRVAELEQAGASPSEGTAPAGTPEPRDITR